MSATKSETDRLRALVSPEGIPYADYDARGLALALPVGAASTVLLAGLRATTTESLDHRKVRIPANAILYMFHRDIELAIFAPAFWDALGSDFAYLGFHGFASYVGVVWPWLRGYRAFRYARGGSPKKPMEQVLDYLLANPHERFALRTDAGKPYGVVRASLVDFSLATGRPLVAVRQVADRSTQLAGHYFPLPGATIESRVSAPVYPDDLRSLTREAARDRLQNVIDALA